MNYVMAIDKGTTVLKVILIDMNGQEYAVARSDSETINPRSGWQEEDAEKAWQNTVLLIQKVVKSSGVDPHQIKAIGVTAHMGGLILLDHDLKPVYNNVLWDDSRASGIVDDWDRKGLLKGIVAEGGQAVLAGLTVPLVRWFADNMPAVVKKAHKLCNTKDYFVLKLTNSLGTEESDAGWMPTNVWKRQFSTKIFELAGVSEYASLFPTIRKSMDVVGGLLPDVAADLGLVAGTPVIAGIGDANASTIGMGVIHPGQGVTIVGTSLLNNIITRSVMTEPAGLGFNIPTVNDYWMRMLPNTGGGSINLRWLVELAYRDLTNPYEILDKEAASVQPGADGVFYHPYISTAGVVAPFYHLGARAQFTGLHTGIQRPELARSVIEGVAYSIRDCFEACPEILSELRLSGGAARSQVLCQTIADVIGKPVQIMVGEEAAARGVAILAATGAGLFDTLDEAVKEFVEIRQVFTPDMDRNRIYSRHFEIFKQIRTAMMPVWTARQSLKDGIL